MDHPMARLVVMASLLLAMGMTQPAWAGDVEDCGPPRPPVLNPVMRSDPARAVSACRRLADRGDAIGQYNVGFLYEYGEYGIPQSIAEAFKWYRRAADQGLHDAETRLGWIYEMGLGVPKDFAVALRWYRKAADEGDA
jgi:TPR repeat protein